MMKLLLQLYNELNELQLLKIKWHRREKFKSHITLSLIVAYWAHYTVYRCQNSFNGNPHQQNVKNTTNFNTQLYM